MEDDFSFASFAAEMEKAQNTVEVKEAVKAAKEKHADKVIPKEDIPEHDKRRHGAIVGVRLDGTALTKKGEITRTHFFDNMDIGNLQYKDVILSPEQALRLQNSFAHMTTGVNSIVPLTCTGVQCPFSSHCEFALEGVAPIGRPCPVEYHLLSYHTRQFIEEFDIQMSDHSLLQLVQELSELIIYEMRATRVLAKSENADLKGLVLKFSPDGTQYEEETIHWAWKLKESLKSRRMKILDTLHKLKGNINEEQNNNQINAHNVMLVNINEKIKQQVNQAQTPIEIQTIDPSQEIYNELDQEEPSSD